MFRNLGKWTEAELDEMIRSAAEMPSSGERISLISEHFLGAEYQSSTLIGSNEETEVPVINLEGLDCFTLLDYVEAMRISGSYREFEANLMRVRYKNGIVSFRDRNHFFTDWTANNPTFVKDITKESGGASARTVQKTLNLRSDGTLYISGIEPVRRTISFIPSGLMDNQVMKAIRTGDYAGIYSEDDGLDVSHVGILIRRGDAVYLRHASSRTDAGRVIDEVLDSYLKGRPGMIILRPLQYHRSPS